MKVVYAETEGGAYKTAEVDLTEKVAIQACHSVGLWPEFNSRRIIAFPSGAIYDPHLTIWGHSPWRTYGRFMPRKALLTVRRRRSAVRKCRRILSNRRKRLYST